MKKHLGFNQEIAIYENQVQFYDDNFLIIVHITNSGYHYMKMLEGEEVEKKVKLSLDKLNKLLPEKCQMTKDQTIYILTADPDA